jgi:hypothetical protein
MHGTNIKPKFLVGLSQQEFEYRLYCYSSLAFVIIRRIYDTKTQCAPPNRYYSDVFKHYYVLLLRVVQQQTAHNQHSGDTQTSFP